MIAVLEYFCVHLATYRIHSSNITYSNFHWLMCWSSVLTCGSPLSSKEGSKWSKLKYKHHTVFPAFSPNYLVSYVNLIHTIIPNLFHSSTCGPENSTDGWEWDLLIHSWSVTPNSPYNINAPILAIRNIWWTLIALLV